MIADEKDIIFRRALPCEADEINALYLSVRGSPFCTWDEDYPGMLEINNDISADSLYVLAEDECIVGAVSVVPENEMDDFECWRSNDRAGEFARVAIRPDMQGRGLSRLLIEGVLDEMRNRGIKTAHISVATVNIPAQRLYRSFGFEFLAEKEMYGSRFFLCEKSLAGKA